MTAIFYFLIINLNVFEKLFPLAVTKYEPEESAEVFIAIEFTPEASLPQFCVRRTLPLKSEISRSISLELGRFNSKVADCVAGFG